MPLEPSSPTPYNQPPPVAQVTAESNLGLAFAAGLGAALVGAVVWAALVAATNYKVGIAAVGIGLLVGWSMRSAGKGHAPIYGLIGAALALLGCVAGDLLADCVIVARYREKPILDVVSALNPERAAELLKLGFQPLDALFYIIAAAAGYRNAFSRQKQ